MEIRWRWGAYDRLVLTVIAIGVVWLCVASGRRPTADVRIVDVDVPGSVGRSLWGSYGLPVTVTNREPIQVRSSLGEPIEVTNSLGKPIEVEIVP
ncbi:MAG: hypothetical protein GX446_14345 [Chthonomonadales bacterium]|nr:hypothetical protein [Chthonomonadales bacterium]